MTDRLRWCVGFPADGGILSIAPWITLRAPHTGLDSGGSAFFLGIWASPSALECYTIRQLDYNLCRFLEGFSLFFFRTRFGRRRHHLLVGDSVEGHVEEPGRVRGLGLLPLF